MAATNHHRSALIRVRFHARRLGISNAIGEHVSHASAFGVLKAYMGHADIATTMIYVHHAPQHDAAGKLSAAVAQTTASGGLGVDPARLGRRVKPDEVS